MNPSSFSRLRVVNFVVTVGADPSKSCVDENTPKKSVVGQKTPVIVHAIDENGKPVISDFAPFTVKSKPPCDITVWILEMAMTIQIDHVGWIWVWGFLGLLTETFSVCMASMT